MTTDKKDFPLMHVPVVNEDQITPPNDWEFYFDVAPDWTFELDMEGGHVILAHPMSPPLAIPLATVVRGQTLPRLDDFRLYALKSS